MEKLANFANDYIVDFKDRASVSEACGHIFYLFWLIFIGWIVFVIINDSKYNTIETILKIILLIVYLIGVVAIFAVPVNKSKDDGKPWYFFLFAGVASALWPLTALINLFLVACGMRGGPAEVKLLPLPPPTQYAVISPSPATSPGSR